MIIKRSLFPTLLQHMGQKEITMLVGPRQAGKTTLLKQLQKDRQEHEISTLYLNLDIETDFSLVSSQERLLKKIRIEIGEKQGIVFIDEIQRKKDAGVFLKGLYDQNLPYKFVVSGSGSLELKERIHESLAGRKRMFELFPLSFHEFLDYRTQYRYSGKLDAFCEVEQAKTKLFLEEYMAEGGYPAVTLSPTLESKRAIIAELYQSYLERDIQQFLHIEKTEAFTLLFRMLATQTGKLVDYKTLADAAQISYQTLMKYLWYMEKTYMIRKVTPFARSLQRELIKRPTYYFTDLGMRNFAADAFGKSFLNPTDTGFLFQHVVFHTILMQAMHTATTLHFWRTKSGAEVDIVANVGSASIPIEVKYHELSKPTLSRSFRAFLTAYHPPHAYVINLSLRETLQEGETMVHILPFFDLFIQEILVK